MSITLSDTNPVHKFASDDTNILSGQQEGTTRLFPNTLLHYGLYIFHEELWHELSDPLRSSPLVVLSDQSQFCGTALSGSGDIILLPVFYS